MVLEELEVSPKYFRAAVKCVLHTILFNRVLGEVEPAYEQIDKLDLSFAYCNSQKVINAVDEKLAHLCAFLGKHPRNDVQVGLSFFEREVVSGWISSSETLSCWEQWVLPVKLVPPSSSADEAEMAEEGLKAALRRTMFSVVAVVNANQDRIPKSAQLTGSSSIVFPFEVHVPSERGWGLDSLMFWRREEESGAGVTVPLYSGSSPVPSSRLIRE